MTWATDHINAANCHGTVVIDDVLLNCPAWAVLNVTELWRPASLRGEDSLIPGAAGVLPWRRRETVSKRTLQLLVIGDCDKDGDPYVDRNVGLEVNVHWLMDNLLKPVESVDGTREVVLTLPSGATRTGLCHVEEVEFGVEIAGALTASINLSLPYGRLGDPIP